MQIDWKLKKYQAKLRTNAKIKSNANLAKTIRKKQAFIETGSTQSDFITNLTSTAPDASDAGAANR